MSLFSNCEVVYLAPDKEHYMVRTADGELREKIKGLVPGAKKDKKTKDLIIPLNSWWADELKTLPIRWTREAFKHRLKRKTYEKWLTELSKSHDYDYTLPEGFGKKPFPFQRGGIIYALERERVIIGDDMGLGKTIQGLATIYGADAFPALVVTPSSNKLCWSDVEIPACMPHQVVFTANKKTPILKLKMADVIVTNYEQLVGIRTYIDAHGKRKRTSFKDQTKREVILSDLAEKIKELGIKSIILDEGHYIKNAETAAAMALMELRKGVKYRIILTGTPMMNKAAEFYSPLKFLDRIDEFGGFWYFHSYFCDQKETKNGITADGTENGLELNQKLRATCYVRRLKKEVLTQLPDKTRVTYPVEIDNQDEYNKAEKDLLNWVKDRVLKDKVFLESIKDLPEQERAWRIAERQADKAERAERGEIMVRINALKIVSVEGKLKQAKEWIDNFLASGQKLVVFATHKFVHDFLIKSYPGCARILGEDTPEERQRNVVRFQNDPKCTLLVGGMGTSAKSSPAGVGHTLTAACNTLFLEMGWNNALHDQCEDRCYRIGQKDNVTCHYFVGKGTIEEWIAALIEAKRKLCKQVQDGIEADDEIGILDQIWEMLKEKVGL